MLATYWGARYIHSGLVSLLFGLTPLITSLFAALWLGEEALRPSRLAGLEPWREPSGVAAAPAAAAPRGATRIALR